MTSHQDSASPGPQARLRPLQEPDISEVVSLWYRTWHRTFPDLQHPDPMSTWERRLREDLIQRGVIRVAEAHGRIVGFIAVIPEEHYLDQIFVDPAYHGRGIGTALLDKAKELSPQGLTLHTLQRNRQASRFYERHGFTAGPQGTNPINGQANVQYRWQP